MPFLFVLLNKNFMFLFQRNKIDHLGSNPETIFALFNKNNQGSCFI